MNFRIIRIGFVLIGGLLGLQLGLQYPGLGSWGFWLGSGLATGALLVGIESLLQRFGRVSVRGFPAAVFGLLFGLIMAKMVSDAIALSNLDAGTMSTVRLILAWVFGYIGMTVALRGRDEFSVVIPYVRLSRQDRSEDRLVVDTSAIIDGRIVDLCRTRFLEGHLVVPRFVLRELQAIADSAEPLKRNRGRRGLDVLSELRNLPHVDLRIHEEEPTGAQEVDAKLVRLAQLVGGKVVTTDFNLNKVAELQNVSVLNVNELAQALRPVVLPGETLEVKPIKEGKEPHQAVAYLEDGTMVVVENGRHLIGHAVRGVVTSVLQTAAGRMVFLKSDGGIPAPVRPPNGPPSQPPRH